MATPRMGETHWSGVPHSIHLFLDSRILQAVDARASDGDTSTRCARSINRMDYGAQRSQRNRCESKSHQTSGALYGCSTCRILYVLVCTARAGAGGAAGE